ncbi:hypothetical protein Apa02nite_034250 [Actinoplanes palleronii]|uniref:Uncharacterized protein n=1 Tax=Actinoplanes palleronii TaxID=113570 RepID=A0ABQ4B9P4_9ACTN|nr:hypothetical protein Apa02nite_034250 [Actinoplanes palleronii]
MWTLWFHMLAHHDPEPQACRSRTGSRPDRAPGAFAHQRIDFRAGDVETGRFPAYKKGVTVSGSGLGGQRLLSAECLRL